MAVLPSEAEDGCELGEGADLGVGPTRQALPALVVAVAPNDVEAEGGGAVSVPGVRRLEGDPAGGDAEALDGELVDLGMRLVDADLLDGKHGIEKGLEPRALDR